MCSEPTTGITFRSFVPEDAPRMVALQGRCLAQCPDISLLPEGFYFSPGLADGKNVVVAIDTDGNHVGHAMVIVAHIKRETQERLLWMDIRVEPALDRAGELRSALLDWIMVRARSLAQGLDRPAMLYATYFAPQGQASIDYLAARGFRVFEHIHQLHRDLSVEIPAPPLAEGLDVRECRMETEAEQRLYLAAFDAAFQNDSKPLDRLQHFLSSPVWAAGTALTAFHKGQVVGSVLAYYHADYEQNPGRVGATEYVFVLPEWQRRGIARHLVAAAMRYLKDHGMAAASLEVLAHNTRAVALYESLGYERAREEVSLGLPLIGPHHLDAERVP